MDLEEKLSQPTLRLVEINVNQNMLTERLVLVESMSHHNASGCLPAGSIYIFHN
jgi:hypothetical protein